jgi:hypothetical protein
MSKPPIKQKYIETPEKMWEYFQSYRTETKGNPIPKAEQKKGAVVLHKEMTTDQIKEAVQVLVEIPAQRPLTLEGFYNWLEDNDIISNADHYFSNRDNAYESYLAVCSRVRRVIRQDQIEGGMAGIYNPSITQRLNGLVDKTEVKEIKEQPLFGYDKPE